MSTNFVKGAQYCKNRNCLTSGRIFRNLTQNVRVSSELKFMTRHYFKYEIMVHIYIYIYIYIYKILFKQIRNPIDIVQ
jgi:hypothetical protein